MKAGDFIARGWVGVAEPQLNVDESGGDRKESKDNIAIRAKNSRASILPLSEVGGVGAFKWGAF
jgi:hypothetical protein